MPKRKTLIRFSNIHQLWQFAQHIGVTHIHVNTAEKTLVCDCSATDLEVLSKYQGEILEAVEA